MEWYGSRKANAGLYSARVLYPRCCLLSQSMGAIEAVAVRSKPRLYDLDRAHCFFRSFSLPCVHLLGSGFMYLQTQGPCYQLCLISPEGHSAFVHLGFCSELINRPINESITSDCLLVLAVSTVYPCIISLLGVYLPWGSPCY